MSKGYPSDWDSRRKKVYRRDNYTCQNCGRKGGTRGDTELHVHHIVPKSKGGTHKLSNLKAMCSDCHNAIHGNSMAPTTSGEGQSTTQGFFAQLEDISADSSFLKCPLCDSDRIGTTDAGTTVVRCSNCEVEFNRRGCGFEIVGMNDQLLNAELPFNYSRRMKGYSLRPSIWKRVGSVDDISQLDLDYLEEKSEQEEVSAMKMVAAMIPVSIGIYFFIFMITGSSQMSIVVGGIAVVTLGLFVGNRLTQTDVNITE